MPYLREPGLTFQQDNAPIHTARIIRGWFLEIAIPTLEWPPYSPDLNPIEHVWWELKRVLEQHPHLKDLGNTDEAYEALINACKEAWKSIPDSFFENLIDTHHHRIEAVIAADGWHTQY